MPIAYGGGVTSFAEAGRRHGYTLVPIQAETSLQAVRTLGAYSDGFDALFILPETQLVTPWSMRPLVRLTLREAKPIYGGFLPWHVAAGSSFAVLSDFSSLPKQLDAGFAALRAGNASEGYIGDYRNASNPRAVSLLRRGRR